MPDEVFGGVPSADDFYSSYFFKQSLPATFTHFH